MSELMSALDAVSLAKGREAGRGYFGRLTRSAYAMVLAGGRGSRLKELTDWRCKPAVPFGGKYRIIDFTLSNCVNSGVRRIGVATQYKSYSLLRHLQRGWSFLDGRIGEHVDILPAQQQVAEAWYRGTADAVFQNLNVLRRDGCKYVLVLSGDHVYKMDYGRLLEDHAAREADATLVCVEVPLAEASAFGVVSVDASGRVTAEKPIDDLSESAVDQAMTRFVGTFDQTLPAFSARKLGGVKFYELARRGEEVPETTKEVTVAEFARTGPLADGNLPFRLSCSSGTYARALAHDLGAALGCGGHLAALRRSAIGPFLVEDALPVEEIGRRREAGDSLGAAWLPLDRIPLPFQEVVVDPQQERRLRSGQTVLAQGIAAVPGDWIRLADRRGALVAVGTVSDRVGAGAVVVVQPRIVFRTEPDMVGSVRT